MYKQQYTWGTPLDRAKCHARPACQLPVREFPKESSPYLKVLTDSQTEGAIHCLRRVVHHELETCHIFLARAPWRNFITGLRAIPSQGCDDSRDSYLSFLRSPIHVIFNRFIFDRTIYIQISIKAKNSQLYTHGSKWNKGLGLNTQN